MEKAQMKIYKAMVAIEGESSIYQMDAIEHEGKFWLVPTWLDSPDGKQSKPLRLILLDSLQHQRLDQSGGAPADFAVNNPIPKAVLDGRPPKQEGFSLNMYVVVEAPDLIVDRSKEKLN
jgi:hypothetical protein